MFLLLNEKLETLIRTSRVLKQKLSPDQIEKFVDRSRQLPVAGQTALIEQLKKEKQEFDELEVRRSEEAKKQVEAYEKWTISQIDIFRKETFTRAEKQEKENLETMLEEEIRNI